MSPSSYGNTIFNQSERRPQASFRTESTKLIAGRKLVSNTIVFHILRKLVRSLLQIKAVFYLPEIFMLKFWVSTDIDVSRSLSAILHFLAERQFGAFV